MERLASDKHSSLLHQNETEKSFIRLTPGCCPSEKNVNVRLNFQKDEHFKIKLASLVVEYYNICDFSLTNKCKNLSQAVGVT